MRLQAAPFWERTMDEVIAAQSQRMEPADMVCANIAA